MKAAIAGTSQCGYNTCTDTVYLVSVEQRSSRKFRQRGSTMLKLILLLVMVIATCAIIEAAVRKGPMQTSINDAPISCSHQKEGMPWAKMDTCTGTTWNYLVLATSWPQTFCIREGQTKCKIPENVNSWVIHGLWPSCYDTEGPASCNRSAVFDPSLVKDLLNDMNKYWPNLLVETPYYDFWVHEWCKHGTCSSILPSLDGEHTYFTKTLELFHKYNLQSALEDAGIVPSNNKTYTAQELSDAIEQKFSVSPFVGCITDNHVKYLTELYICMDKNFSPMDCRIPERSQCKATSLKYPVIIHD